MSQKRFRVLQNLLKEAISKHNAAAASCQDLRRQLLELEGVAPDLDVLCPTPCMSLPDEDYWAGARMMEDGWLDKKISEVEFKGQELQRLAEKLKETVDGFLMGQGKEESADGEEDDGVSMQCVCGEGKSMS